MLKKTLSRLVILIAFTKCYAQGIVGIYNHSISITPSHTVTNNTAITVTGQVVNTSTTSITGTIHVNIAIDTSSTSTPKYFPRSTMSYPVVNLLPNATIAFSVNDNASNTNGYKIAGNGTTVVAWPIVGALTDSLTCKDSAFANIYVLPIAQNINEYSPLENELKNIPNPLTQDVQFIHADNWTVELIDLTGKTTEIRNFKLEILNFEKGMYFIRFKNKNGNQLTKKVVIL